MLAFGPLASLDLRNPAVFEDSGSLGLGEIVGKDPTLADDGAFASGASSSASVSCRNK